MSKFDRFVDDRIKAAERGGDAIRGVFALVGVALFVALSILACRLTG